MTNPLDVSTEGFIYYFIIVVLTLYLISNGVEYILSKYSSITNKEDISLISRRIAAISIHIVVLILFIESIIILSSNNNYFLKKLPSSIKFKSDWQKFYFYLTKTSISSVSVQESSEILSIALLINASFNGIDGILMYLYRKGYSAESSSLLIFHHWTIVFIESCIFNLDLLNKYSDYNWTFSLIGFILIIGCVSDLLLSPSTVKCIINNYDKSHLYKKLLWFHLLFNLILLRGIGISVIAFDFVVSLWQIDYKYGAAFQISLLFMWLQWSNLGRAIFSKIQN